jgi:hypothetical protein
VSVAGDEVGGTNRPRRSRVMPAHYVAYEQSAENQRIAKVRSSILLRRDGAECSQTARVHRSSTIPCDHEPGDSTERAHRVTRPARSVTSRHRPHR